MKQTIIWNKSIEKKYNKQLFINAVFELLVRKHILKESKKYDDIK